MLIVKYLFYVYLKVLRPQIINHITFTYLAPTKKK